MDSKAKRRKMVTAALELTANTTLAASPYEVELLDKYVEGLLTLDAVIELTEVYKLLLAKPWLVS